MATGQYVLARGFRPSARLNLQFHNWRAALGFDLHGAIIDSVTENFKVADVATGTGIWLIELSQQLPTSVVLDGFDISDEQYPHSSSIPENVTLRVMNALEDPPDAYAGKYDAVHVRLLNAVIENNSPASALRHCHRLLKPRGLLQWDEIDAWQMRRVDNQKNELSPNLDQILQIFRHTQQTLWIGQLAKLAEECGFDIIANELHFEKTWQRHGFMENWCLVVEDFASKVADGGSKDKADKIFQLVEGAYSEIKRGLYFSQPIRVVVVKKHKDNI